MSTVVKRPHFSSNSNDIISYHLYQPFCMLVEPLLVRRGILPTQITSTRCFADVAAGAAIIASSIDGDNRRRWVWILAACLCVMYIGMSDDLDGYIARKYNLKTWWGQYTDGIADAGGWIITWLAMLYAFGFKRVALPFLAWCLLAVYGYTMLIDSPDEHKMKAKILLTLHCSLFPLLVAVFYACYPLR
jgi:phosphatidylglycerophosphate synthase